MMIQKLLSMKRKLKLLHFQLKSKAQKDQSLLPKTLTKKEKCYAKNLRRVWAKRWESADLNEKWKILIDLGFKFEFKNIKQNQKYKKSIRGKSTIFQ